jgi:uncharacterized membrane protein YbhN (UPF0104 family)
MGDSPHRFRWPSRGRLVRWAGTLVSSGLFIWLVSRQNWARTWESLVSSPVWLLPLVFLLYFLGMLLNTLRWNLLLRAQQIEVPFLETLKIVITGAFASNFLPSTIGGDSVRIVSLLRFNAAWSVSVASVVLDRFLNVVATLTLLPFSLVAFGSPADLWHNLSATGYPASAALSSGLAAGWAEKWTAKFVHVFKRLLEVIRIWLDRPAILLLAFALSWLSSFIVFFAVWVLARGLGMPVALYQVLGVMALTYLLSMLPVSINGLGLREVAVTTLYMQLGATLEQASTLAVVTRFMLLLEALPGALWLSELVPAGDELKKPT